MANATALLAKDPIIENIELIAVKQKKIEHFNGGLITLRSGV